jgi:adenosine deaminase
MKLARPAPSFPHIASIIALSVFLCVSARAQTPTPAEMRTSRALDAARANPLDLHAFLIDMPKGTDLHSHLSGAVYSESWIRAAAEDQLCVNLATLAFAKPPHKADKSENAAGPTCDTGNVPASQAYKDQHLYDELIDSFSMRGYVPSPGITGHDHFFDTFDKFGGTDKTHKGEWLYEVAARAAAQNIQYMELMETPAFGHAIEAAHEVGWNPDLPKMQAALLKTHLSDDVEAAKKAFADAEAARDALCQSGKPGAADACAVKQRFIYQILRGNSNEQVFAQTLLGFLTIQAVPHIVGINFVMPEDGFLSMANFEEQMKMLDYLHSVYPNVHISMHAGELASGLVTDEGLCCHIHWAVELGHAERIGHGVDIMYEKNPYQLMDTMAKNHVMVEIALTSNDVILGISGKDHPFPIYRKHNVPISLSTDDEGVSRIDLTHEYVRAVETYNLRYTDLKQMIRTGMEHSFQPGDSLWPDRDNFKSPVPACAKEPLGAEKPTDPCAGFLQKSEKATQQWELERRFHMFESTH